MIGRRTIVYNVKPLYSTPCKITLSMTIQVHKHMAQGENKIIGTSQQGKRT